MYNNIESTVLPENRIGAYFRTGISETDKREITLSAILHLNMNDGSERTIHAINCTLEGETVVDYDSDRDNWPATQVEELYSSLLDGTYFNWRDTGSGKTVLYCRTASGGEIAVSSQKDIMRRYCELNGYNIKEIYCDCNVSGLTLTRPSLQKLYHDIRSGDVKRIIVTNLSRLARNLQHINELVHLLSKYGVELIAINDGGLVDVHKTARLADAMLSKALSLT